MTNNRSTKRALLASALSLVLCFTMLLGTTYAWFTDSVTSAGNIIKSGTLDVEMYWADGTKAVPADDSADWTDASAGAIFNYDKWEPGYTEVRHIKIANEGTLALKYAVSIVATGTVSDLADVIDVYYVDPAVQVADRAVLTDANKLGTLTYVLDNLGTTGNGTLEAGKADTITLALKMQETAGNEYQNKSIGSEFAVQLVATQLTYEEDSLDENYDVNATYPVISAITVPAGTTEATPFVLNNTTVWIPAGDEGEYEATVSSESVTTDPATNKTTLAFDLSLTKDGAKVSGTDYPIEIYIGENLIFDKVTHKGEVVDNATYDMFTGIVSFTVNSFSPFAVSYSKMTAEPPVSLPTGVSADSFGDNVAYVNGSYYSTLKAALLAIHTAKAEENTLYLKPGADLGFVSHVHVCTNLTVYGNGAYISDGERDFEIGYPASSSTTCAGIDSEITLSIHNLNGCAVWGSIKNDHPYDVNVNLYNCKDVNKVSLLKPSSTTASASELSININNCTFTVTAAYRDSAIYCQNLTNLKVVDTTFTDYAVGLNQNNRIGVENYSFEGCTFVDCATPTNVTGQTSYAAPIRAVASVAGAVTNLTITDCEFVYTNGEAAINGDILTYQSGNEGTVNVIIDGVAQ